MAVLNFSAQLSAFILMYHGETSQPVWVLFGARYWKEYCNHHRSFMSLFDRIFFVGTFFILDLLFYFCSGVCSIIPFQKCWLILYNIEGQSEFSTIANSWIDGNIKKCLNPHFFRCIYWLSTVFYPAISWCYFLLLAALIYLKPKMHNVAIISVFVLFFVIYIHLWTVNWLYSHHLILLSGDIEISPGPRHNSGKSFSICHLKCVCLLTITQNFLRQKRL